jgi:hypothetical protein
LYDVEMLQEMISLSRDSIQKLWSITQKQSKEILQIPRHFLCNQTPTIMLESFINVY